MYQIILDTNVIVSSFRSNKGASYRLTNLIPDHRFEVNLSTTLVLEYEEVLKRQATDLGVDDRQIDDVIDYLCKNSNRRRVHYLWRPSLSDPDDDFLLELAVECESDYIVTYNSRDFLAADRFQIRTVTPREFLKVIGEIE